MPSFYTREPGLEGYIVTGSGSAPGIDMASLLRNGRPPLRAALEMGAALADIVSIAQEDSLVHGDIKPGLIKLESTGAMSLEGYGLNRRTCRAPERSPTGIATDVYGMGITLHAMLSDSPIGALPRDADSHDQAVVDRVLLMDFGAIAKRRWVADIRKFLAYCLAFEPSQRPSPLDVANILAHVAEQCPGMNLSAWAKARISPALASPAERRPPPKEENLSAPTSADGPLETGMYPASNRQAPAAKGECTAFWTREKIHEMLKDDEPVEDHPSSPPPVPKTVQRSATPPSPPPPPSPPVKNRPVIKGPVAPGQPDSTAGSGKAPGKTSNSFFLLVLLGMLFLALAFLAVVGIAAYFFLVKPRLQTISQQGEEPSAVMEQGIFDTSAALIGRSHPSGLAAGSHATTAGHGDPAPFPSAAETTAPGSNGTNGSGLATPRTRSPASSPSPRSQAGNEPRIPTQVSTRSMVGQTGMFQVTFLAQRENATVSCGDGQTRTFVGSTSLTFDDLVTCKVQMGDLGTALQLDSTTTVQCQGATDALVCTRSP